MDNEQQLSRLLGYSEQDPNNINLLLDITDLCLQLNDDRAQSFCDKAQALSPQHPRGRFLQANLMLQKQDYAAASPIYTALIEEGTDNLGIRHNLALALAYSGEITEVAAAVAPFAQQFAKEFPRIDLLYARSLYHLGEVDKVRQVLTQHIETYPHATDAMGLLAMLYGDEGESESARQLAERTLQLAPDNHEAKVTLAHIHLESHDFEDAYSQFTDIIELHPNSGRARLGAGLIEMKKGDLAAAEVSLLECVRQMESHLGSWSALGWTQIALEKFPEAEATFRHAIKLNGTFSESHGGLACLLALTDQHKEAEHEMKLACRLDANSFSGRFAEVLLLQQQQPKKAEANLNAILHSSTRENGPTLLEDLQKVMQSSQPPR